MADATFPLHEIEEGEDYVPRYNSDVEDDGGHTGETTHLLALQVYQVFKCGQR